MSQGSIKNINGVYLFSFNGKHYRINKEFMEEFLNMQSGLTIEEQKELFKTLLEKYTKNKEA